MAIGAWVGISIGSRNAERRGLDPNKSWNLGLLMVLTGLLGAKILLVLNDWNHFLHHPGELLSLSTLQAGGVFSGGLICALLAATWYLHHCEMPVLTTADCFAPGLALGHAIGRLGCFSAGCCYGKATHAAWGGGVHQSSSLSPGGDSPRDSFAPDAIDRIWSGTVEFSLSLFLAQPQVARRPGSRRLLGYLRLRPIFY